MLKTLWHKLPFTSEAKPHVVVVKMSGVIAAGRRSGSLNLEVVGKALKKAFDQKDAKAVVLVINSPGGSPVQSDLVLKRVRDLAAKKSIPVLSYIEDVGASGGYMIALAGDEIFANPYAIVGSIGVLSSSFGVNDAISKLGIERRVYTAGENKSQLDPFLPEDPGDVARLRVILEESHKLFRECVEERRGGRIKGEGSEVFSGNFWIASEAQARGLIDGTGDFRQILQERFGDDVVLRPIAVEKQSMLAKLLGSRGGAFPDAEAVLSGLQNHIHWARFGK